MKYRLVFVHGWGVDSSFWNDFLSLFPGINCTKIDLGFIGKEEKEFFDDSAVSPIYITHSLGTAWVLKNHSPDIKALVSINGFCCFKNFVCARTLMAMKKKLKRNPALQMEEFWKMCGISPDNTHDFNIEKLQTGLEWLSSWDAKEELKALSCPVLSLAGSEDPLLSLSTMKEEWEGFNMHVREGGAHILPLSDPAWCAKHIKAFVRDL